MGSKQHSCSFVRRRPYSEGTGILSTPLHIGIVGCGAVTQGMHLPIVVNIPGVCLDFVADLDPPKRIARDFGTKALCSRDVSSLPNCDIVLLATPLGTREPYIEEFGRRGSVVFAEKPFARDVAEHRRFLELAPSIACNYMRTTYSAVRQLAQAVESRWFGQLQRVFLSEGGIVGATGKGGSHYQTDRRLSGGGILIEGGTHLLSELVHILPEHLWHVEASALKVRHGLDVDIQARLRAEATDTIDIEFDLSIVRPVENRARFIFEQAELVFEPLNPASQLSIVSSDTAPTFTIEADRAWARSQPQAFYLKWLQVLNLARGVDGVDSALETSLATTSLAEHIYRAGGQ